MCIVCCASPKPLPAGVWHVNAKDLLRYLAVARVQLLHQARPPLAFGPSVRRAQRIEFINTDSTGPDQDTSKTERPLSVLVAIVI